MKKELYIVENNFAKFFAAKQLLEAHFRLKVNVMGFDEFMENQASSEKISLQGCLCGDYLGISNLIAEVKRRKLNRRNSVVHLVIKDELSNLELALYGEKTKAFAA